MVAWNNAVIINTARIYRAFLLEYPDSDLTATARKLEVACATAEYHRQPAAIGGAPNAVQARSAPAATCASDQRLACRPRHAPVARRPLPAA